jgi:hypothetical protein
MQRTVPAVFVLTVAAVALGAIGFAAYWRGQQAEPLMRFLDARRAPTVDEAEVSCPLEYALHSEEANDVVFLGDSTCHSDIDPGQLHGFSSYNLGSTGGVGPLGILMTGSAYLRHHPRPKAVVLCVSPLRFEVSSRSGGGSLSFRLVGSYGPEIGGIVPLADSVEYFVKRGATQFGRFADRRDDPLWGLERETYHTFQSKSRDSRGFFALPKEHGGRWNVEMPGPATFILPEWTDAIRRLAKACHEAGVTLLIRFGPVWNGISHARDFGQLETWSQQLEASFPCVTVARPIIIARDRDEMWDGLHLNARGVEAFMPVVAKDVQAALGR